jgi:hypothetical protein
MRSVFFDDRIDDQKFLGHLYGLGAPGTLKMEGYDPNAKMGTTGIVSTATANELASSVIANMGGH